MHTFTKMHGIGNDYLYFNCIEEELPNPSKVAKLLSHRNFGVGGDGIILISPPTVTGADFQMRIFNSDGSEAETCGNGLRCFAKYVYEKGLIRRSTVNIQTKLRVSPVELTVQNGKVVSVRVDMGEANFDAATIPVISRSKEVINQPYHIDGQEFLITCVSMGNPHVVIFVPEVSDYLVQGLGPKIETDPMFPKRTNVEFVKVISPDNLLMRVWERGAGETYACGSGASAVLAAGIRTERTSNKVNIQLLGGELLLEQDTDGHIHKTGPAEFVFEGRLDSEILARLGIDEENIRARAEPEIGTLDLF